MIRSDVPTTPRIPSSTSITSSGAPLKPSDSNDRSERMEESSARSPKTSKILSIFTVKSKDRFCVLRPDATVDWVNGTLRDYKFEVFAYETSKKKSSEETKIVIGNQELVVNKKDFEREFIPCKEGPVTLKEKKESHYWNIVYKSVPPKGYYLPRPDHEFVAGYHPIKKSFTDRTKSIYALAVSLDPEDVAKVRTEIPQNLIRWVFLKIVRPTKFEGVFINRLSDWVKASERDVKNMDAPLDRVLYERIFKTIEPGTLFPSDKGYLKAAEKTENLPMVVLDYDGGEEDLESSKRTVAIKSRTPVVKATSQVYKPDIEKEEDWDSDGDFPIAPEILAQFDKSVQP